MPLPPALSEVTAVPQTVCDGAPGNVQSETMTGYSKLTFHNGFGTLFTRVCESAMAAHGSTNRRNNLFDRDPNAAGCV